MKHNRMKPSRNLGPNTLFPSFGVGLCLFLNEILAYTETLLENIEKIEDETIAAYRNKRKWFVMGLYKCLNFKKHFMNAQLGD